MCLIRVSEWEERHNGVKKKLGNNDVKFQNVLKNINL